MSRKLEWDTAADLTPDVHWGDEYKTIQNQREAADNLDKDSKMVILSYSNYFTREEPEGKPSKKHGKGSSGAGQGE